jgi:aquaporin Z
MTREQDGRKLPWRSFLFELIGTALLLLGGLSVVILVFGTGSPVAGIVPSVKLRQMMTGFLFGCCGAAIALSSVGKVSGAHINPAVTLGFWLMRRIDSRVALGYVLAQLAGAILGSLPLLGWGSMGRSVSFGATVPGDGYTMGDALVGEAVTTYALIVVLCVFLGFRSLRLFTPFTMPILYSIMVPLEASISGTSTNPARTIGPAMVSGSWQGWWVYWLGPFIGTFLAILTCSFLAKRITEAKLYHFETDRRRLLRKLPF